MCKKMLLKLVVPCGLEYLSSHPWQEEGGLENWFILAIARKIQNLHSRF